MLPYRYSVSRGFSAWLHTRLLSMPDPSTSELLRTLWMNGCFQANMLFRQPAEVSLPRPRVARMASAGMLTGSSICLAFRLIIRLRLTPGRLTSPGNPWSYGGGESHPPYRYLCLHLLFRTLHGRSRDRFGADRNAPLPIQRIPRLQRVASYPIIIHARSLD